MMDGNRFKDWVNNQLIPSLTSNFQNKEIVVVMDNAPYHSVRLDKTPFLQIKQDCKHI
jgi:hypothetical protein